jgi:hypothetical protein
MAEFESINGGDLPPLEIHPEMPREEDGLLEVNVEENVVVLQSMRTGRTWGISKMTDGGVDYLVMNELEQEQPRGDTTSQ